MGKKYKRIKVHDLRISANIMAKRDIKTEPENLYANYVKLRNMYIERLLDIASLKRRIRIYEQEKVRKEMRRKI